MNAPKTQRQALNGITVLDLSRDLAGPLIGQMLADLGAFVIKVEQPGAGDETRGWGPPFVGEQSAYFLAFNRNKHAMTIDLKQPQGQEIARALLQRSDVLIENFRGETAERLGWSPDAVRQLKPDIIHVSVSGFGREGVSTTRPGYDIIMQGLSGLMSITGTPGGEPTRFGVPIIDVLTGLHGAIAVLTALYDRLQSHSGQWIDLALYDVALSALFNVGSGYLNTHQEPRRHGNAHPNVVPYQPFPTADGEIIIAVANNEQWRRLCHVIGRDELVNDPRFRTNADRVQHHDELSPYIEERVRQHTTAHWEHVCSQAGIPYGPIRRVSAAFADPVVSQRQLVWEQPGATEQEGSLRFLANPLSHMSQTPARLFKTPPALGEDTERILSQFLGYSDEQIRSFREENII